MLRIEETISILTLGALAHNRTKIHEAIEEKGTIGLAPSLLT